MSKKHLQALLIDLMLECTEEHGERLIATEAGCRRVEELCWQYGINVTVTVDPVTQWYKAEGLQLPKCKDPRVKRFATSRSDEYDA